jgi:hypothetical protein
MAVICAVAIVGNDLRHLAKHVNTAVLIVPLEGIERRYPEPTEFVYVVSISSKYVHVTNASSSSIATPINDLGNSQTVSLKMARFKYSDFGFDFFGTDFGFDELPYSMTSIASTSSSTSRSNHSDAAQSFNYVVARPFSRTTMELKWCCM